MYVKHCSGRTGICQSGYHLATEINRSVEEEHWQGTGTSERLFTLDRQDDGLGNMIHYWVLGLFDDTLYIIC